MHGKTTANNKNSSLALQCLRTATNPFDCELERRNCCARLALLSSRVYGHQPSLIPGKDRERANQRTSKTSRKKQPCAIAKVSMFEFLIPQKSVKGHVVLITGGAMGIGRLMALKFAKLGAIVVVWDLNAQLGHSMKTFKQTRPHAMLRNE